MAGSTATTTLIYRDTDDHHTPDRPQLDTRSSTAPSELPTMQQLSPDTCIAAETVMNAAPARNRSPYSRHHGRSRSSGAAMLNAPLLTRAKSMPNPHTLDLPSKGSIPISSGSTSGSTSRSLSPNMAALRSAGTGYPSRARSPLRLDDGNVASHTSLLPARSPSRGADAAPSALTGSAVQTIEEDSELDLTSQSAITPISLPAASAAFARSSSLRRRPASPLHNVVTAQPLSSTPYSDFTSSASSSPSMGPTRFVNETYPLLHHSASTSSFSSVPSTPSSIRSRSPSISSLDTIEDTPDLESEAIELERIERLKIAAERAERAERGEDMEGTTRRRGSLDVARIGFGRIGRAGSEKKRWSICGGERRGDLDLETIWED